MKLCLRSTGKTRNLCRRRVCCFGEKFLNESCNFSLTLRISFATWNVVTRAAEHHVQWVIADRNLLKDNWKTFTELSQIFWLFRIKENHHNDAACLVKLKVPFYFKKIVNPDIFVWVPNMCFSPVVWVSSAGNFDFQRRSWRLWRRRVVAAAAWARPCWWCPRCRTRSSICPKTFMQCYTYEPFQKQWDGVGFKTIFKGEGGL